MLLALRIFLTVGFAASSFLTVPLVRELNTDPVGQDSDDPAFWQHPRDFNKSLIIGTNKAPAAQGGALVVMGMDGKIRQRIADLDRPNNVDAKAGVAAVTERLASAVRVYDISESGLRPRFTFPVFAGETGPRQAPMGIALYRRPKDGALFAIVGRKSGPAEGYLWQYRIEGSKATKVREFGAFSGGQSEIEAIAVDDENGFVYYADEDCCIRKWRADPDDPNAATEVATFGREGFQGNREGIAIRKTANGGGYVICTDQIPNQSRYYVFRRTGNQSAPVALLQGTADSTDGLEVVSGPRSFLIAMNSKDHNFVLFRWPSSLP
jgi:3-phytase